MMVGEHEGGDTSLEKKSRMRAKNKLRAGAGLWCQVLSELHGVERVNHDCVNQRTDLSLSPMF